MRKFLLFISAVLFFTPGIALAVSTDDIDNTINQMNNVAEQTSSTLNRAKQLIHVATTTTGIAVDAYNKTEKAVSSTVEVVRRGSAVYNNLKPIFLKIGDAWNWATNNSEPLRVAAVVGGIIVIWVVVRFIL